MENNENEIKMVGEFVVELNEQGPPGAPGLGITSVTEIGYDSTTGIYTYRITYSDDTYYDFDIHGTIEYNGTDGITVTGTDISIDNSVIPTQTDLQNGLATKQDTIDSSNKLSSDLVDDTNATHKFATASQLSQISTNQSDISTINSKIPSEASSGNKLTDKSYVDTADISLQDQINVLKARGRFLALWDCSTGLAESNPPQSPYVYHSGDYFIVGAISTATPQVNYKPSGSSYTTGVASSTLETDPVDIDDVYYYDGTSWRLQINTQKTVSFVNIAGDPYDNTNLATALNDKQDTISDLSDIRDGAGKGETAVQPSDLATVATTGDYNDLLNKPTIPTVNDGTITLTQGGVTKGSFTVNQSGNSTIDLDSGSTPTNIVTTDTTQDITGVKAFVGDKRIKFKQSSSNNKLGFTLYDDNNTEVGTFEYRPNTIDGIPLLSIGNYATTSSSITYNGFRESSTISGGNGAYNLLCPLVKDAKTPFNLTSTHTNFYMPLGFTLDGTNIARTDKTGILNLGSVMSKNLMPKGNLYILKGTFSEPVRKTELLSGRLWNAVAYDNSKFVAISNDGYISTSTDGDTWSSALAVTNLGNKSWISMIYDGSQFIALSETGYISKSTNGITWDSAVQNANLGNNSWVGLACTNYGAKVYVAISNTGYVSTSRFTWNDWGVAEQLLSPVGWKGIVYYKNYFTAISDTQNVSSSPYLGNSWSTPTVNTNLPSVPHSISCSGDKLVVIGGGGGISIGATRDSFESSSNYEPIVRSPGYDFRAIAHGNGKFVAISTNGYVATWNETYSSVLYVPVDSTLSSGSTRPVQNKVINAALNNKQNKLYAGIGMQISGNTISISPDSQLDAFSTNAVQNAVVTAALNNIRPPSVSITGGNAISVGSGGSLDYNNPTQIHPDPNAQTQWHAFCYDGTQYVTGGEFGEASVSTDCTNWNPVNTQIQGTITCIAFNAGKFVFAHNDSSISFVNNNNVTDSSAYNTTSSANNEQIISVMASGQDFFYGGYDFQNNCGCIGNGDPSQGQIHMQAIQGISAIAKVTNANGIDFGCGTDGNITYYDVTQNNWQVVNISQNGRILNIVYNGTNYIAIDEHGNIFTSNGNDYTQWQQTGSVSSSEVPIADFTSNGTDTLYVVSSGPFSPDQGFLYVSDSNNINFTDYAYQTQGATYTVYYGGGKILIGCEWGFAILYGGSGGYVINCIVDNQLDLNSTNPVENRVVTAAINNILDILQRNNIH